MALKIFQDISDYFKYDNNHWTQERKNELKKRILVYGLLPTILFSGYCISKRQFPWKMAYSIGEAVQIGGEELNKDFPMRALAHFNSFISRNQKFSKKELSELLDNPYTEENIKRLVQKDKTINYSEIGGAAVISEKDGKKYLKFIDIETEDMKFSKEIIEKKDSKEYIKRLFFSERSEKIFEKINIEEGVYASIANTLKNEERNAQKIDWLVKHYLQVSNKFYQQTKDEMMELFYLRLSREKTIGGFHIHLEETGPSINDLRISKQNREFVIECRTNGYLLYELMNGKINNEISMDFKR